MLTLSCFTPIETIFSSLFFLFPPFLLFTLYLAAISFFPFFISQSYIQKGFENIVGFLCHSSYPAFHLFFNPFILLACFHNKIHKNSYIDKKFSLTPCRKSLSSFSFPFSSLLTHNWFLKNALLYFLPPSFLSPSLSPCLLCLYNTYKTKN